MPDDDFLVRRIESDMVNRSSNGWGELEEVTQRASFGLLLVM